MWMRQRVLNPPQQPQWYDAEEVRTVRAELASRPGLVRTEDVAVLRSLLARVVAGHANVVQAGDCAESLAECTAGYVARKAGLVEVLAGVLKMNTHKPVIRVGRIAGQFAKPRSSMIEQVDGLELPVYRGEMVNDHEPDPGGRRADPRRMLLGYDAASAAMTHLGWGVQRAEPPLWTSHEALLLDYEIPMLRREEDGRFLLSSTHWPWIGDRTRQPDGPYVALLSRVVNPVACKVGPSTTTADLLALSEKLDPEREPGRLTLIARLGANAVVDLLPPLVAAVHAAGHPVVWLTDPMHANTVVTSDGIKTRFVESITREVRDFQVAVRSAGGVAGGVHLETTPDDVTECVLDSSQLHRVGDKYTTLCDPRLTLRQAISVVASWTG
jgi:3-deoxy-7-phosphoheptulonate synthase